MILRFVGWPAEYYRHADTGEQTGELANVRQTMRPLRHLFGSADAA